MVDLFGYLIVIGSALISCYGLPKQIITNHKRKSCDGINPSLVYIIGLNYLIWTVYAFLKKDWYILASQVIGLVFIFVGVVQVIYYRYFFKKSLENQSEEEKNA